MAYADFTYYQNTYLGDVITDSAAFDRLSLRASTIIDRITFGRAAPIVEAGTDTETIDKIQMATCAIAEEIQKTNESGGNAGIASESVGSHSVSYIQTQETKLSPRAKYEAVAKDYLWDTYLLFRGFFDGEYSGLSDDEN